MKMKDNFGTPINDNLEGEVIENIGVIYKLHNGMELLEDLKNVTDDETFIFYQTEGHYAFENSQGQRLIVDKWGTIVHSDIEYNHLFEKICEQRLKKTEEMMNGFKFIS